MTQLKSSEGRELLAAWRANRSRNYLQDDPNMQRILQMHLGAPRYASHEELLNNAATLSAVSMDEPAIESNRDENLPRLSRFNGIGECVEQIKFHPSYHQLGTHIWSTGVLSVLREPGNGVLSGALFYFIAHHGEAGHTCPVACTAGLIKLLQRTGSAEQQKKYLPGLLNPDYTHRVHAAQFVTEIQGGSDVGLNCCVAAADPAQAAYYRISGEKWFCSVADAGLYVITARPEGAPPGTRGLGLFLVPRTIAGTVNHFAIRRLKYKLGTQSLASAEIDFNGAVAEPVGPLEQGFRNMVGIVLDTSRVHNALAACGLMRRACIEAAGFARYRCAFGKPIIEHPMVAELVARVKVITCAALATTFRVLALGDRLASGEPPDDLEAARRIHVNINKYWTSVQATRVVRDAIEVLGGNGTIEEFSVLPRLYRDAIVLESWEGTHNTLCAQVLRDFAARGLHRFWLAEMSGTLSAIGRGALEGHRSRALALLEEVNARIERLDSATPEDASFHIRSVVDRMCELNGLVSLLAELDWELEQGIDSGKALIVDHYRWMFIDPTHPMDDSGLLARIRTICTLP